MKAILISDDEDRLLFSTDKGKVFLADDDILLNFLLYFNDFGINSIYDKVGKKPIVYNWQNEYVDFSMWYSQFKVIAYLTDHLEFCIREIKPFTKFIKIEAEKSGKYISIKEYAEKHGKTECYIRRLCNENRLLGARKVGRGYIIPEDAKYPTDERIRNKKYIGVKRKPATPTGRKRGRPKKIST